MLKLCAYFGQPISVAHYIRNIQKQPITRASVSSITYKLWACRSETAVDAAIGTLVTTGTFDKNACIFDELQPWALDKVGYNAKFEPPAAERTGALWHRYEVTIVPSTGEPFPIVWAVLTKPMGQPE